MSKSPEHYRELAEKCRDLARKVAEENNRADLLARGQTWDLIADRIGQSPRPRANPAGRAIGEHGEGTIPRASNYDLAEE